VQQPHEQTNVRAPACKMSTTTNLAALAGQIVASRRPRKRYGFVLPFLCYLLGLFNFPLRHYGPAETSRVETRGKHVISFSLYGDDARYSDGAIANAKLYKSVYNDWQMRVYYDHSVPEYVIRTLQLNDVELVNMSGSSANKMTWRFLAASDPSVSRVCCRDIDSRLSLREKAAVEEWIFSGKAFHAMRDHPSHSLFALSGGMWCTRSGEIRNIGDLLEGARLGNNYLEDMDFLNSIIWPIAKQDILQHDSFSCQKYNANAFPVPRVGMEHVGAVFVENEMREVDVALLRDAIRRGEDRECIY
jgi:hypothetical protein